MKGNMTCVSKTIVLAAVLIFMTWSCRPGVYEILSRDTSDPRVDKGVVESFKESHTITMKWQEDTAADTYIVERAVDAQILDFKKVYEGEGLSYADRGLVNGQRYIYRLKKTRGKKVFGPYEEGFGVSSLVTEDEYEPNNLKEQAVLLSTNPLDMNMYFYESENGLTIYDEDWFCIDVPPLRRASITIRDSEVVGDDEPTHFRIYEDKLDSDDVSQLVQVWLRNTEREAKRIYFKIYPDENRFRVTSGGAIIRYTIQMGSIMELDS